jgi:uncharacterized membrane protein YhaH (DUF805 family)
MWGWILHCFRNYAEFEGRASRPEYWWFYLFTTLCNILLNIAVVGTRSRLSAVFLLTWSVIIFLPSLAVASRRLHDGGHSFWWAGAPALFGGPFLLAGAVTPSLRDPQGLTSVFVWLIVLIFVIAIIAMFVFLLRPSDVGPNRYGDPAPIEPD